MYKKIIVLLLCFLCLGCGNKVEKKKTTKTSKPETKEIYKDDNKVNRYVYFNIPDSDFSKTHTRTKNASKLPSCQGTKYTGNINQKTEVTNDQRGSTPTTR